MDWTLKWDGKAIKLSVKIQNVFLILA